MPYQLTTITPPATEPLTYDDLSAHMRLDGDEERALVASLITAGRTYVEERCHGLTLITTTYDLVVDELGDAITLPRRPVQSVTSVTYVDGNGDSQTLAADQYTVEDRGTVVRVVPAYGVTWPVARCQPDAVTVRFVAGYGAAADVPDLLKLAIKSWVAHHHGNREAVLIGKQATALPHAFDAILSMFDRREV